MEVLTHSKTGLMKRIDRYIDDRKKNLLAHVSNDIRHTYMNTRLSSIRDSNNYPETNNNSQNLVDGVDNTFNNTHTTTREEPNFQFCENATLIGNTHEILKYIIKNENIHSNDPKDIEKFLSDLPEIEGISYDRSLNRFKTKIPVKFTNRSIEQSFYVEDYGLKNAWLKSIGSLYTNIASLVFDCPAISSKLKHNIYSTINDNNQGLGTTVATNGNNHEITFNYNTRDEIDDWSDRSSSCSSNSYGDLFISGIEDVFDVLNNINGGSNSIYNLRRSKGGGKPADNRLPPEALTPSRSKKALKHINEDPKRVAESLKPWHPNIFWIPSICRWRTMYYDANKIKHSKTFTPACFGGVKEAYYAAVEFRNMIDSMDMIIKERAKNQLGDSGTAKWEERTESINREPTLTEGAGNHRSMGDKNGFNGNGHEYKATDSEVYDERENEIKGKKGDSESYNNDTSVVKDELNKDLKVGDKFNNLIRRDQPVMANMTNFITRNKLGKTQSEENGKLNESLGNSDGTVQPVSNYTLVNYKKFVSRIKIGKRGRPMRRGRMVYGRTTDDDDGSYHENTPYNSNVANNGGVLDGGGHPSGYDANFLSGLDTKGLYIPIPFNWENK